MYPFFRSGLLALIGNLAGYAWTDYWVPVTVERPKMAFLRGKVERQLFSILTNHCG